MVLKLYNNQK